MNSLKVLPSDIIKTIVLPENDKAVFEEYSASMADFKSTKNLFILYSDSLYQLYSKPPSSFCSFTINRKVVLQFDLKDLFNYVTELNALSSSFKVEDVHPPVEFPVFSERISVSRSEGMIFIYDYLLNKIAITTAESMIRKAPAFKILKPDGIDKKQLLRKARLDEREYDKHLPLLQSLNRDKIHFEGLYHERDTLYVWVSMAYPEVKNDTNNIVPYFFIIKYAAQKWTSILYIDPSQLKAEDDLSNGSPFYINRTGYHLPIFSEATAGRPVLSSWKATASGSLTFEKKDEISIPVSFTSNDSLYSLTNTTLSDKIYFYGLYPFLINLNNLQSYDLAGQIEQLEGEKIFNVRSTSYHFYLQDVAQSEHLIGIFYFMKEKPAVAFFDKVSGALLSHKELSLNASLNTNTISFIDLHTLCAFSKGQKKIFILR